MPAPLISVVIPCCNHAHFLREAVESACTSAQPTEVIVVNDGSTDDTPAVLEALRAKLPMVRGVHQRNRGLAAARNRGLRESGGAFVVFLDADDRLAPGGLDMGAAALQAHPDAAMAVGRCLMISRDGAPQPTPERPRVEADHFRALLRDNFIWMPAMAMFRREALERAGGFDGSVNASADYDLYLRVARHHPVHDHARVVAHYRKHDANMSGDASRMLRETLAVVRRQRRAVAGDPTSAAAWREGRRMWQAFYGTHLVNEIRAHVARREWLRAVRKALTLLRHHPRGLVQHLVQKLRLTMRREPARASRSA